MTHLDIPETMRAAILVEQNAPLVVDDVALPRSLECGQVLVKVLFSGICGSQLGEIAGVKGPDRFLPHLLGHEAAAEVIATGPGVKTLAPGDRVVLHWRKGAGIEAAPPRYTWKGRPLNAGFVTTFNSYAVVSENRATAIPRDFPARVAPLFGCAVTTGIGVVENNARVKIGESVVVFGAGGVGLNIIQGAALSSAHPVIAVDLFDNRLDLALRMGATAAVNAAKGDAVQQIRDLLGPSGADVVVDNTGAPAIIAACYELTAPQGRTILVGVPKKGNRTSLYTLPLHFGKVLTGSHGGEAEPETDIPRFIRLYEAGKLRLDELITEEFSLDEINEAIARMRDGSLSGRCVISFD